MIPTAVTSPREIREDNKMARHTYYVVYKSGECGEQRGVCVAASSKAEAYDTAVYEVIPKREGTTPYSAWVESVTYQNGKSKTFNTSEGNAY